MSDELIDQKAVEAGKETLLKVIREGAEGSSLLSEHNYSTKREIFRELLKSSQDATEAQKILQGASEVIHIPKNIARSVPEPERTKDMLELVQEYGENTNSVDPFFGIAALADVLSAASSSLKDLSSVPSSPEQKSRNEKVVEEITAAIDRVLAAINSSLKGVDAAPLTSEDENKIKAMQSLQSLNTAVLTPDQILMTREIAKQILRTIDVTKNTDDANLANLYKNLEYFAQAK